VEGEGEVEVGGGLDEVGVGADEADGCAEEFVEFFICDSGSEVSGFLQEEIIPEGVGEEVGR